MKIKIIVILLVTHAYLVKANSDTINNFTNKNNGIILSVCNFAFPKILPFRLGISRNLFDQCGIYYERRVYKNLHLSVGYSQWNSFIHQGERPFVPGYIGIMTVGSFQYRQHYKMLDVYLSYKHRIKRKHVFDLGIGASYYTGLNTYIDTIIFNPDPPFDALEYSKSRYEHYWGIVPFVKYDYSLWSNRLSLGADFRIRKYFGLYSAQIDYGIHLSVNF